PSHRRQCCQVQIDILKLRCPRDNALPEKGDDPSRGQTDEEAAGHQDAHRPRHAEPCLKSGTRVFGPADTQENGPIDLDEAGHRQGADQRQSWSSKGSAEELGPLANPKRAKEPEVDQKLADEAVEWWQPADGYCADEKTE